MFEIQLVKMAKAWYGMADRILALVSFDILVQRRKLRAEKKRHHLREANLLDNGLRKTGKTPPNGVSKKLSNTVTDCFTLFFFLLSK